MADTSQIWSQLRGLAGMEATEGTERTMGREGTRRSLGSPLELFGADCGSSSFGNAEERGDVSEGLKASSGLGCSDPD